MNLITDEMLDSLANWPNGFAAVCRECVEGGLPYMGIHIYLRTPSTENGPEMVTEFFLNVVMNRPECRYLLSLHTGDTRTPPIISALVFFGNERSASMRIDSVASRFGEEACAILRFLHPLVLRFYDESLYDKDIDGSPSQQRFYFDQSTVASLNNASGLRFGVMVMELKRLLRH